MVQSCICSLSLNQDFVLQWDFSLGLSYRLETINVFVSHAWKEAFWKNLGLKMDWSWKKSLIDSACKQTLSGIRRENEENVKVGREESKLNVVRCLCPQSKDAGKQPAFLVSTYITWFIWLLMLFIFIIFFKQREQFSWNLTGRILPSSCRSLYLISSV